ncbi:MAG: DedA family protein [candidate division Zixibacteria bacterium]|nr:DedA family protein [candidate division Zixibacteria bacterium]
MFEHICLKAEDLLKLAVALGPFWFYLFIFFSGLLDNFFPPYPGDTVTFIGGYLAGTGLLTFSLVFFSASLGCLAGAMILYVLGKNKGRGIFLKNKGVVFNKTQLEKVEVWFKRYGEKVLILSRFLTGVRSLVALTAGVGNVKVQKMTGYTLISIILWNSIILFSAFKVQENWREILGMVQVYNKVVLTLVILIVIAWLIKIFKGKFVKR